MIHLHSRNLSFIHTGCLLVCNSSTFSCAVTSFIKFSSYQFFVVVSSEGFVHLLHKYSLSSPKILSHNSSLPLKCIRKQVVNLGFCALYIRVITWNHILLLFPSPKSLKPSFICVSFLCYYIPIPEFLHTVVYQLLKTSLSFLFGNVYTKCSCPNVCPVES